MPFTKVTAAGIESSANFIAQNLNVTGVITLPMAFKVLEFNLED